MGSLKLLLVSDDELHTQSILGELPGEALQEKAAVATLLCISRPLGIAPQQGARCCQFHHSHCN